MRKSRSVLPSEVVLDPAKRYYISVLPGDAMDPGHAMGGAPVFYKNGAWQVVKVIRRAHAAPDRELFQHLSSKTTFP